MLRRASLGIVLGFLVFALAPSAQAQAPSVNFGGRAFEAGTNRGIENLEVRVTPPRNANLPIRLARTDRDGRFVFRNLVRGPYLLEVSQGVYLLYRVEIDTRKTDSINIPLRRRR